MLQRAASNAYSWWWVSHIRTKQSKWLDSNLLEMEEKVKAMIKLIDEDGDSFAKKAELYFRRRPELINHVEEAYRAYKALADRYDRISGDLHKANHTIATAFPDQVQLAVLDDDEDGISPKALTSIDPSQFHKMVEVPQLDLSIKNTEECSAPKRTHHKKIASHINKEKAHEEIEKVQKEILVLQTEKEFVKSSYQSSIAKYWDIERQITEMQEEVCSLQDAFSASAMIEDNEARALMAATAVKSCEDSLVSLQQQQKNAIEEARIESERIKDAKDKLMALKGECGQSQQALEVSDKNIEANSCSTKEEENVSGLKPERLELQPMCQKVREHFEMSSETSMVELAEKIDELVDKVINLELTVASQTAQIKTLRSETDELQKHLRGLEEDKVTLIGDSNSLTEKLKQAEEELQRVQHLEKCVHDEKGVLQARFSEACHSFNDLSKKLQSPKHQEQVIETQQAVGVKEEAHVQIQDLADKEAKQEAHGQDAEKDENLQKDANKVSEVKEIDPVLIKYDNRLKAQLEELFDVPDLHHLLLNGVEGRQKILLAEYTSILHNYKDTKQRLSELEKKNQEYHSDSMAQVKELNIAYAMKDEEMRILRRILSSLEANANVNAPRSSEKFEEQVVDSISKPNAPLAAEAESPYAKLGNENEPQSAPASEDKFRADIDTLLDENVDFWLRFSTSYHQIQKFQTTFKDLQNEIGKLKNKSHDVSGSVVTTVGEAQKHDSVPVDKRLRELNTDVQVWLEKNALLKGELQCRFTSLCSIQDEISRVSKASENYNVQFTPYQAAKFQGEVFNMQLENKKVDKELQAGIDHVRGLQGEIIKALSKLRENFEPSASRNPQHHNQWRQTPNKTRIPLRTFLFGAKPKKPSLFSRMNPAYQKQCRDLRSGFPT